MIRALLLAAIATTLAGCDQMSALAPKNTKPPEYIKELVAYKEGSDGFMVYLILADSSGSMTAADGTLELSIHQVGHRVERSGVRDITTELYSTTIFVSPDHFQRTKVGRGSFERDALIYPVGRITYAQFSAWPAERTGTVSAVFKTASGRTLRSEETIFF